MKFGLYSITLKGLDGVDWPGGRRYSSDHKFHRGFTAAEKTELWDR